MINKRFIQRLKLQGLTYEQIGKRMGVSRQRIQQLLSPPPAIKQAVMERANGCCQECGLQLNGHGHIHHEGGEDYAYNNLKNLQYLCLRCHSWKHSPIEPTSTNNGVVTHISCNRTMVKNGTTALSDGTRRQKYLCPDCGYTHTGDIVTRI